MSDDLVKRLRDWEHVWLEDEDEPDGGLYILAADRIEELEARLADAMADALIVIQNGTSDQWVKNLRPTHIRRMVGLLAGGKDE